MLSLQLKACNKLQKFPGLMKQVFSLGAVFRAKVGQEPCLSDPEVHVTSVQQLLQSLWIDEASVLAAERGLLCGQAIAGARLCRGPGQALQATDSQRTASDKDGCHSKGDHRCFGGFGESTGDR